VSTGPVRAKVVEPAVAERAAVRGLATALAAEQRAAERPRAVVVVAAAAARAANRVVAEAAAGCRGAVAARLELAPGGPHRSRRTPSTSRR
jgi:hypothetical protein